MAKSKVAVLKVKPESILQDIERLCELAGMKQALAPGHTTILKDNISWHYPFPGGEHDAVADGGDDPGAQERRLRRHLVRPEQDGRDQRLQGRGPQQLRPALQEVRHPRPLQLQRGGHEVGRVPAQGEDARAPQDLPRRDPDPRLLLRQEHRPPPDGEVPHLHDDHGRDEERVRRPARDASATTRTRGSTARSSTCSPSRRRSTRASSPIMDGTTAGNGPGPRTMFPVIKDYMLASADQVAIDAVAAKMMGFDPMIARVHQGRARRRLGVGDPRDIEIVGDDISKESWGFHVGDNGASKVGDLMWFGPMKRFQKLFFHTPLVNVFIFGSEAYHDYYRWPLKDRRTFETWKAETSWGRLFERLRARRGRRPQGTHRHGSGGANGAQNKRRRRASGVARDLPYHGPGLESPRAMKTSPADAARARAAGRDASSPWRATGCPASRWAASTSPSTSTRRSTEAILEMLVGGGRQPLRRATSSARPAGVDDAHRRAGLGRHPGGRCATGASRRASRSSAEPRSPPRRPMATRAPSRSARPPSRKSTPPVKKSMPPPRAPSRKSIPALRLPKESRPPPAVLRAEPSAEDNASEPLLRAAVVKPSGARNVPLAPAGAAAAGWRWPSSRGSTRSSAAAREQGASDLHVVAGRPLLLRIRGDLLPRGGGHRGQQGRRGHGHARSSPRA